MKGRIIVEEDNAIMLKNNANAKKEKQILKSNATFRLCKSKSKTDLLVMQKILILLCQCIIS